MPPATRPEPVQTRLREHDVGSREEGPSGHERGGRAVAVVRPGLPPVEAQAGESPVVVAATEAGQAEAQEPGIPAGQPADAGGQAPCSSLLPRCPASVAETFCRLRFPAYSFQAVPHPSDTRESFSYEGGEVFTRPLRPFRMSHVVGTTVPPARSAQVMQGRKRSLSSPRCESSQIASALTELRAEPYDAQSLAARRRGVGCSMVCQEKEPKWNEGGSWAYR